MTTIDIGGMIVVYNFFIGVLVMLSSEKIGALAGHVNKTYAQQIERSVRVSSLAFGSTIAGLMGAIYLMFFTLKIDF
jgi:hypothetical protein